MTKSKFFKPNDVINGFNLKNKKSRVLSAFLDMGQRNTKAFFFSLLMRKTNNIKQHNNSSLSPGNKIVTNFTCNYFYAPD